MITNLDAWQEIFGCSCLEIISQHHQQHVKDTYKDRTHETNSYWQDTILPLL